MSEHAAKEKAHSNGEHGSSRRKHKRHKGGGHEDAPMAHDESNWLVSYADMMTLLFGFFVLMYSFSKIDDKKFEVVRKDVAKYFGGQVKKSTVAKKVEQSGKEILDSGGFDQKSVEMVVRESEIELRFNGALHFLAGTSTLNGESQHVLGKLIEMVKANVKADTVRVEGHTDDDPMYSTMFPSNWELSAARASTVVREFEKFGFDPAKLTASGFSSSRPISPNRDSKGIPIVENQEMNRRVVVVIGFNREVEAAVKAMKTNEFVSADVPEYDQSKEKTDIVRAGEGEQTWKEKVNREMKAVQEKLNLAEERLKDTEEKSQTAKQLAEMHSKLINVEKAIVNTEKEISQIGKVVPSAALARKPASPKKKPVAKKKVKPAAEVSPPPTPKKN